MWRLLRSDAVTVLDDRRVQRSLARYLAVMQDEKPAKFLVAKALQASFSKQDSLEKLWQEHARLTEAFPSFEAETDAKKKELQSPCPEKSYLDLKIEIADRILRECCFCTRQCRVNRTEGKLGYCGCGDKPVVSSIFEHMGEEPELVPSGTIFTMGCTMRCKHCQNWTISQWQEKGEIYQPQQLAQEVENLRADGCRNANLVGGEPTPWLKHWLETFKHVNVNIPVVWNSNSYYSPETVHLLAGFADIYLLDFKYGPGDCAARISDALGYWEVCTRNHLEAKKHGELIIRVLVLPSHLECCSKPILDWIAENLGVETRVNIMFQYRPEWKAHEISELRRKLTRDEMEKTLQLARDAGLVNYLT
ncbi:MAG: radical SAM protein [Candidatus Bathyarchaeota archaeon]|nr:radical SAM protein [Candidatus Bathyarchaeota archaeon]